MEVRINKEVRDYQESLFFGLSLRQLIFALLAVAVAEGVISLSAPWQGPGASAGCVYWPHSLSLYAAFLPITV